MLLTAQQNYEDAGVWKGSTDYVQCLSSLATSAVQSVDGVEHVRVSHVSPHLLPMIVSYTKYALTDLNAFTFSPVLLLQMQAASADAAVAMVWEVSDMFFDDVGCTSCVVLV